MKNLYELELVGNIFKISKNCDAIRHIKQGVSLNQDELIELQNFAQTHSVEFIVPFGGRYKRDKCSIQSFIGEAKLEYLDDMEQVAWFIYLKSRNFYGFFAFLNFYCIIYFELLIFSLEKEIKWKNIYSQLHLALFLVSALLLFKVMQMLLIQKFQANCLKFLDWSWTFVQLFVLVKYLKNQIH